MTVSPSQVTGVVLAGGQGKRMSGNDKGLLELDGMSLVEHSVAILGKHLSTILISANRNVSEYAKIGLPVIQDEMENYQGPLAGILATMKTIKTDYLLCIPCDTPGLPDDLVERMLIALSEHSSKACCAFDGKRIHPVINVLHRDLLDKLEQFLATGQRKLQIFLEQVDCVKVDFSDEADAFININTPYELESFRKTPV